MLQIEGKRGEYWSMTRGLLQVEGSYKGISFTQSPFANENTKELARVKKDVTNK